jgi:hypothetical protein
MVGIRLPRSITVPDLTTRQYERSQFVRCNTFGHAWFDYDNSEWKPQWGLPLVLRCERCGTERRDTIGATGQKVGRSYIYPEGYKYEKGTRPNRDTFRLMFFELRQREQKRKRSA